MNRANATLFVDWSTDMLVSLVNEKDKDTKDTFIDPGKTLSSRSTVLVQVLYVIQYDGYAIRSGLRGGNLDFTIH